MDVVLLRKLAWKSVFNFGKYEGQTVQQVFDLGHTRTLRWYYYNLSKISFIPEILRAIGIEERDEIEKPGTNSEQGQKLDEIKDNRMKAFKHKAFENGDKKAMGKVSHEKAKQKKVAEIEFIRSEINDNRKFSKGRMMRKNHGHNMGD